MSDHLRVSALSDLEITPFILDIDKAQIADLTFRLNNARLPSKETVSDWSQGVPLKNISDILSYWKKEYDWRKCESLLNGFGQFLINIGGMSIHFLHKRSQRSAALPLLLTHGWPSSILEFRKVIDPLTNPALYGADASDAFHLIVPSLPGFGFSSKPEQPGCGVERTADIWSSLMKRLGYDKYVAQGGDWGAAVATAMAAQGAEGLVAIHVTTPISFPDRSRSRDWSAEEKEEAAAMTRNLRHEVGYYQQQRTRPQTLAYGLADSPVGQAAWIYEKWKSWTDCGEDIENVVTKDEILDNIMMYWLTNSAASSSRIYWENYKNMFKPPPIYIPTGCSQFPNELIKFSKKAASQTYKNIIHWKVFEKGGHFPALEQPILFVEDVRNCFRQFQLIQHPATDSSTAVSPGP